MTDQQTLFEYRINQAESTLNDARIILNKKGSPRSVVNRAYYAVFYAVLALFLKSGIPIRSSKHASVIGTFDREFIIPGKIEKSCSKIFHSLFDDRQEFDYKELVEVSTADAETALSKAADFITTVKTYLKKI
jgi:uncharacterized protein (UPF0332 family)